MNNFEQAGAAKEVNKNETEAAPNGNEITIDNIDDILDDMKIEADNARDFSGLDQIDLPETSVEEVDLQRQLRVLQERAGAIFEEAANKIKKIAAVGLAATSLFSAGEAYASPAENIQVTGSDILRERVLDQDGYKEEVQRIRREVFESLNEEAHVFVKDGKNIKIYDNILSFSNGNSAAIDINKLRKIIDDNKAGKVELWHTHPLKMTGYGQMERDAVRNGSRQGPVMPPSLTDMSALITLKTAMGDDFKRLDHVVAESGGTWNYSLDNQGELFDVIESCIKERNDNNADREAIVRKVGLNKDEIEALAWLKGKFGDLKEYHMSSWDARVLNYLENGGEIGRSAVKKFKKYYDNKVTQMKEDYPFGFADYQSAYKFDNTNPAQERDYRENTLEKVEIFRRNGVKMEFLPYGN